MSVEFLMTEKTSFNWAFKDKFSALFFSASERRNIVKLSEMKIESSTNFDSRFQLENDIRHRKYQIGT